MEEMTKEEMQRFLNREAEKGTNEYETFRACYKWIPDDMKEDLTPDQLGRLTDQFYECYGGKCVNE